MLSSEGLKAVGGDASVAAAIEEEFQKVVGLGLGLDRELGELIEPGREGPSGHYPATTRRKEDTWHPTSPAR
jgi:hypothetical protein